MLRKVGFRDPGSELQRTDQEHLGSRSVGGSQRVAQAGLLIPPYRTDFRSPMVLQAWLADVT